MATKLFYLNEFPSEIFFSRHGGRSSAIHRPPHKMEEKTSPTGGSEPSRRTPGPAPSLMQKQKQMAGGVEGNPKMHVMQQESHSFSGHAIKTLINFHIKGNSQNAECLEAIRVPHPLHSVEPYLV